MPAENAVVEPMLPRPYRVLEVKVETADVVTLVVAPAADGSIADAPMDPRPGQFNMVWAFGVGEVPISVSGSGAGGTLVHTIRSVGTVSSVLARLAVGGVIGVRGPFGTGWDVESAAGNAVVVVGGGIGVAPLRPVVQHLRTNRDDYGHVSLLVGARSPDEIVFTDDLEQWAQPEAGIDIEITVDAAGPGWDGHVGVVTDLIARAKFDPSRTVAFVCGPEAMMRFATRRAARAGCPARSNQAVGGAQHAVRHRALRTLPARRRVHMS